MVVLYLRCCAKSTRAWYLRTKVDFNSHERCFLSSSIRSVYILKCIIKFCIWFKHRSQPAKQIAEESEQERERDNLNGMSEIQSEWMVKKNRTKTKRMPLAEKQTRRRQPMEQMCAPHHTQIDTHSLTLTYTKWKSLCLWPDCVFKWL